MSVAAERPVEVAKTGAASGRGKPKGFDRPRTLWVITGVVYTFLFAPILIVILFSFNSAKSLQTFDGFSFRWYEEFFNDESLRTSLFTSIEIAAVTTVAATRARDRARARGWPARARARAGRRACSC